MSRKSLSKFIDEERAKTLRLEKAAPDMLSALESLMQWAEHTGGWEAPCWKQAEKALKKARG